MLTASSCMDVSVQSERTQMPNNRSVLIADSEFEECELISDILMRNDFEAEAVHDGANVLRRFIHGHFAAIVLRPDLPIVDGICVLQEIRMRSSIPALLLASREDDYIQGLKDGADDFVMMPFEPMEFLTRLRRILRCPSDAGSDSALLQSGDLCLNLKTHEAWLGGEPLELTSVEFAILKSLLRARGRIVSRDEIAAVLYQRASTPFERTIDVHISNVRRKIEPIGRRAIRTVRGVGYLFAPITLDTQMEMEQG